RSHAARRERKQVTALFADLKGSMGHQSSGTPLGVAVSSMAHAECVFPRIMNPSSPTPATRRAKVLDSGAAALTGEIAYVPTNCPPTKALTSQLPWDDITNWAPGDSLRSQSGASKLFEDLL